MSSAAESYATKSAAAQGAAIGAGALDPRDMVELYLARAQSSPRIFARVAAERARREAAAAADRAKRGMRRHPLDGVSLTWKDLVDVQGEPTHAGSRLLAGRAPAGADAPLVARAAAAGLVCLGKTHLSELAFSGLGYNPMTQTPPNVYDADAVPGGSSSGAATSVAFAAAAAAVGSDTGGSVRIPAAWNGLAGLKTSIGRLPMAGVTPLSPSLDTIGPIVRDTADAALLFSVLAAEPPADLRGADLRGARFLIATTVMFDNISPNRRAAFEHAIAALRRAGAECVEAEMPEFAQTLAVLSTDGAIVNSEGYALWGERIEAAPDQIFDQIRERFRSGREKRADQAEAAHLKIAELRRAAAARLAGFDAVLSPTTPNDPPPLARVAAEPHYYVEQNLLALRNTRLGSLLNFCALTLPTPPAQGVFPGALMIAAAGAQEARLLRLGSAIERALQEA